MMINIFYLAVWHQFCSIFWRSFEQLVLLVQYLDLTVVRLIKFLELFLPVASLLPLAFVCIAYYPKMIGIISGLGSAAEFRRRPLQDTTVLVLAVQRKSGSVEIHIIFTFDWFISSKCSSIFGFENWFGCDSRRPSIFVAKFPDFNPELGTFPTLPRWDIFEASWENERFLFALQYSKFLLGQKWYY